MISRRQVYFGIVARIHDGSMLSSIGAATNPGIFCGLAMLRFMFPASTTAGFSPCRSGSLHSPAGGPTSSQSLRSCRRHCLSPCPATRRCVAGAEAIDAGPPAAGCMISMPRVLLGVPGVGGPRPCVAVLRCHLERTSATEDACPRVAILAAELRRCCTQSLPLPM